MNKQQEKEIGAEPEDGSPRIFRWRKALSSSPFGLTAIVALVVLVSFFAALIQNNNGPTLIGIVHVSCGLSLAVLAAIVSAVSERGWKIHFVTFFLLLLDGLAVGTVTSEPRVEILVVLLPLSTAIPILITLEAIKFFAGTFTKSKLPSQSFVEGLQFKTKHLFIATAALALVIVIAQSLAPYFSSGDNRVYVIVTTIVVLLSVNALVSVWAMLGRTVGFRLGLSFITAAVFLGGALSLVQYTINSTSEISFWIAFTTLSWTTSSLQLYLFRRQGYRFVRHRQ